MRKVRIKSLKSIINKFIKLSLLEKFLCVEILFILGYVRFIMLYRNFEKLGMFLGERKGCTKLNQLNDAKEKYIDKIVGIVDKISIITPWKSECLVKAATKMYFLKKKKIHATVYLGVKKEGEVLLAHAWLMIDDRCISGNEFRKSFTSIDFYTS